MLGFERLGHWVVRRRRWVLALGGLSVLVSVAFGARVQAHLSQGGFDAASEQAQRAADVLQARFHSEPANFVVLVRAVQGRSVDDRAVRAAGLAVTAGLSHLVGVESAESYWSLGGLPALRSRDSRQALVVATIAGDQDHVERREPALAAAVARALAGPGWKGVVTAQAGGFGPSFHEVNTVVEKDLLRSEAVAVPLTMLVLLFVFGSAVAATLPLAVGGLAITGTLLALRLITSVTAVSIFALNLTTAMGLGLAIDYSLFMVARFREELADHGDVEGAVVRTLSSAGRAVAGSALTVAAALSTLAVFPIMFLRSFAIAGGAVALLSGAAAVIVLPALLATLGLRVNSLTVWSRSVQPRAEGVWSAAARRVMRRPWLSLGLGVAFLLALGAPVLGLRLGYFDQRVLAPGNQVRQVNDGITRSFGGGQGQALSVVPAGAGGLAGPGLDSYALRLSEIPGVAHVDTKTGVYVDGHRFGAPAAYLAVYSGPGSAWVSVVPSGNAMSPAGVALVHAVRSVRAPVPVLVGGQPANYTDSDSVIFARLPLAVGLIALVMVGLLFLLFRSVVLPLKALVLNLLSLSATFGAMVWVFQQGHLSGVLGFTPTGSLVASMPVLMFCVAFGLSMDYEVFLVSRIKEQHDAGVDNEEAVARGLQSSGRIVTAAALLMSIVFMSLVTGQISFIKLFGVGLTLAVLVDAFVIRGVLLPAFMKVAGPLNWWPAGKGLIVRRWLGRARQVEPAPSTLALLVVALLVGGAAALWVVHPA